MKEEFLLVLIAALGAATVVLSVYVACRFAVLNKRLPKDGRRLSTALLLQLIGEGVMGVVTLVFSVLHWLNVYDIMSVELASFLRLVAFGATGITTAHLCAVVSRLHNDK